MPDHEKDHTPIAPPSTLRSDWLPAVLMGSAGLAVAATFFYLAVYFKEGLGFSGTEIGLLMALHAVTGVLVTAPAGLLNDRLTSRSLVIVGLLGMAVALAGLALVRSFWPVLGVYFVWGLAHGTFRLSLDVQVLKTDSGERTGQRLGLYQGLRFGGLGLGLLLAGALLGGFGFERHFLLAGGVCLGLVFLATGLAPTRIGHVALREYRADLRRPRTIFFAAWLFLFASHWGAETTSYGLFLREHLRLTIPQMGLYMSGEFVCITATLLVAGRHFNSEGRMVRLGVLGMVLSGIGHIGMIIEPPLVSVFFRSIHGAGDGLMFLVMYFGIARLFAIERRGGNTGFVAMITMLGTVCGSLVYGPMGEQIGYQHPFWISGALSLLLAAGLGWAAGSAKLCGGFKQTGA